MAKLKKLKPGTIVVFDPATLNKDYWDNLSYKDKIKCYGDIWNSDAMPSPHFLVFLCEIKNAPGHCVLVSLTDQKIHTMRHTNNFREVTEDEF